MRKYISYLSAILLCISLLAPSKSEAQTLLPIPPQSSTFGMTRGYWFTAPVGFTVVSMRIPTGVSGNFQSAAILHLPGGPPPSYAGNTNTFNILQYFLSVPGTAAMPCAVPIQGGQTYMILGARSTSSNSASCTNTNSYGAYSGTFYPSTVCGNSMNLTRAGFQDHICQGTIYNVWQEPVNNYYISRVELMVSCGILPAELSAFEAKPSGNQVKLKWTTASENDFAYFEIERAVDRLEAEEYSKWAGNQTVEYIETSDGFIKAEPQSPIINIDEWQNKDFETIGTVRATGKPDTEANYTFNDPSPETGFSYYRLKQVDVNGSATYSYVAEARFKMEESRLLKFGPNPVVDQSRMEIVSIESQTANMEIFNSAGQSALKKDFVLAPGVNKMDLDLQELPQGTYFVKIRLAEGKSLSSTLVKM